MTDEPVQLDRDGDLDGGLIARLSRAVLEGTPVDWDAEESSAGPSEIAAIRQLRIVADVATVHRTADTIAPSPQAVTTATAIAPSWGHLKILEPVGHGAFGDVYRAWDSRLDREVALKLLRTPSPQTAIVATSIIEEGRLLAKVRHPNVITVYGAEQHDGVVGVWTEFVHGRTLAQLLREQGRFGAEETISIGIDVCSALSAVHRAGLLHRDIKSQNVMRQEGGRIVLMDFGAGAERLPTASSPEFPEPTGTPVYLAPELFENAPATLQSDLYSVGVLLYHLVTGAYPVFGRSVAEIRQAHRFGRRSLLRDERPDLPIEFIAVVERALAANPVERFQSAGALEAALRSSRPAPTATDSAPAALVTERPSLSRRGMVWLAMLSAVTVAVVAALGVFGDRGNSGGARWRRSGATAGLSASVTGTRKVTVPTFTLLGRPSFDGRLLSYVDLNGDLAVLDLVNGESMRVTNKGQSQEFAEFSILSPDGKRAAYQWSTIDGVYELRIINTDGSWPRLLLDRAAAGYPLPLDWSHDGRLVLCLLRKGDNSELVLVPVDGGPPASVHALQGGDAPTYAALSPDGRFVAFDFTVDRASARRDIGIIDVERATVTSVVAHPANDLAAGWTPDGTGLLFTSDRSGTFDGWLLPVTGGTPSGEPQLVARNLGRLAPLAVTKSGTFYYTQQAGTTDVYVAERDPATGRAIGPPAVVSPSYVGLHIGAGWSPDGRFLAYFTSAYPGAPRTLTINDTHANTERYLTVPELSRLGPASPAWSPDGSSIIVRGSNGTQAGYFAVDIASLRVVTVLLQEPNAASDYGPFEWSRDGRAMLYLHAPRGVVSRDLATGVERVLVQSQREERLFHFGVSPDGESIAFSALAGEEGRRDAVISIHDSSGNRREIIRASLPDRLAFQGWTRESDALLFTRFLVPGAEPHTLWQIPLTGPAHDTGLKIRGYTQVNRVVLSPDGRRIAYTAGGINYDVWLMENFLPNSQGGRQ